MTNSLWMSFKLGTLPTMSRYFRELLVAFSISFIQLLYYGRMLVRPVRSPASSEMIVWAVSVTDLPRTESEAPEIMPGRQLNNMRGEDGKESFILGAASRPGKVSRLEKNAYRPSLH